MPFRLSGLSARVAVSRVLAMTQRSHFDTLEQRQLLAAAVGHTVNEITGIVESPTLVRLSNVSLKSKALISAGAKLFESVTSITAARNSTTQHVNAAEFTPFNVKLDSLKTLLDNAPLEFTKAAKNPLVLALPNPDGGFSRFNVVEAPIMEPGLADQFSYIKTYRGIGVDDPTATVRLDYTQLGFHAQVLDDDKTFYIDPYFANDINGTYLSYYKQDAVKTSADVFECDTDSLAEELGMTDATNEDEIPGLASLTYGGTLKTYRAAVAGNRPYITAATTGAPGGATTANGQAAIVTAMNRVTGVYETELSIRLTLVANNSTVVYGTDNPLADPYVNTTGAINQNTSNLNTRIGSANYDIGHVFTTGSGGVAQLGCVGGANKGAGTTGTSSPVGDAFTIDYVAHEMGHQFGGNHTFNTSQDGNRSALHAYEPGSGLSIMAYAGIENLDDLAGHSIAYFNAESIDEIRTFVTNTIPSVGTASSTGDLAPTVNAGADYVIPTGTPFALTATGSDPDGDALTYDWQERDRGAATLLSTADNGTSPLFTQLPPSTSATRLLPRINSIIGGFTNTLAGGTGAAAANVLGAGSNTLTARLAERMYAVARPVSTWRVIARDNRGGVATDDMTLNVVNTGGAFAITSNNTGSTLPGGSFQTITWNVAGTTGNGINTANVKISLSLTSGLTFPYVLNAATANDGSETIQIPYGIGATTGRIKVEAVGNIYFDINNAALTITNVAVPVSATPNVPLLLSDTGVSASDGITKLNNASPSSVLDFQVGNTVAGALVELLVDGVVVGSATATGTTTTITTNGSTTFADGVRNLTARQTETGKPVSALSTAGSITVDTIAPAAGTIGLDATSDTGVSNSDQITNDNTPTFNVASADTYLQVRRDGTLVSGSYVTGTSYTDAAVTDGTYTYSVESLDAAGNVSVTTATVVVTVDTVAPALASVPTFNFETGHSLTYVFGEAGVGNFSNTAITVFDGTNNVPATVAYDSGTLTTTITFGGILPNGDYTATLNGASITDVAGNALVAGSPLSFFVLAGDINRDRTVGFDDLLVLAQNYGTTGKTFSTGNVNYDAAGNVDFDDLLLLAQAYGSSLPSLLGRGTVTPASASVGSSLTSSSTKRRIASQVL